MSRYNEDEQRNIDFLDRYDWSEIIEDHPDMDDLIDYIQEEIILLPEWLDGEIFKYLNRDQIEEYFLENYDIRRR